jgi:F-type H+-transporting ATPase subunit gamma
LASIPTPVEYIAVGRKGRDLLLRRRMKVIADFSNLPAAPSFADVSAIGRLAVDEYLSGGADEVYLVYTRFINMVTAGTGGQTTAAPGCGWRGRARSGLCETQPTSAVYTYEPAEREILDEIIPRFTALQVYQAILESLASEHAARMVAMRNATDNARDLVSDLELAVQQGTSTDITNDMLDIAGGAEALAQATSQTGGENG